MEKPLKHQRRLGLGLDVRHPQAFSLYLSIHVLMGSLFQVQSYLPLSIVKYGVTKYAGSLVSNRCPMPIGLLVLFGLIIMFCKFAEVIFQCIGMTVLDNC